MNYFTIGCIAILCLGIGFLVGARSINKIETMMEGVEEGTKYLESLDFDALNSSIELNHRYTNTSFHIDLLIHLEEDGADDAREYLVNWLQEEYMELQDDLAHESLSDNMKVQMDRIKRLSEQHDGFKKVVTAPDE
jgi:hypothetical protein